VLVRVVGTSPEFLLVHPGGPFWARKDAGAWSIPKGEHTAEEDPRVAAEREFAEELGLACPAGELHDLGEIVQAAGKRVRAFAGFADLDVSAIVSNTFEMEWPPRSGRMQAFPEVDRAGWFPVDAAMEKVIPGQRPLIDRALAIGIERGLFGAR
jgi:predicted NUDIX family NTP pyrophosphohydrolase